MKNKNVILLATIPLFCFGIWDAETHDVNNWNLTVTNYGRIGDTENYWFPGSVPFYGAGLLFGSISSQSETLVTVGYGPAGGESEFTPGLKNQNPNSLMARIYMYPSDWPPDPDTYPMAPQLPLTFQESWSCYNDFDSLQHIPGDGKPIGIEVYQTTFADTLSIIKDVIYLKYEVENCTTYTINDAIVSIFWDQSLLWNGFILHKWFYPAPNDSFLIEDLGYCYGENAAIGVLFIKTPDDLGCTANKVYPGPLQPTHDNERYLVMAGYSFQNGIYAPYDSLGFAGRAYMSSGKFSLAPGETKEFVIALIASYYINNDTLPLAIVAKNARDFYLDSLLAIHENRQPGNPELQIPSLQVYPNPFRDKTKIRCMIQNTRYMNVGQGFSLVPFEKRGSSQSRTNSKSEGLPYIRIYDATGRLVKFFTLESCILYRASEIVWDGTDDSGRKLPAGVYFVRLETEDFKMVEKVVLLR